MGRDKATLIFENEPLWSRQLKILRELQPQATWISAREHPTWAPADLDVVLDVPPSSGPLSGIASALARLQTSHLLVLAIDLPKMTAAHLGKLISLARPGRGVVPVNQDLFEPLAAAYPKEAGPVAQSALDAGEFAMQSFCKCLRSRGLVSEFPVSAADTGLYLNLNTPTV